MEERVHFHAGNYAMTLRRNGRGVTTAIATFPADRLDVAHQHGASRMAIIIPVSIVHVLGFVGWVFIQRDQPGPAASVGPLY